VPLPQKKFCSSKDTSKNEMTSFSLEENIHKHPSDKRFTSKIKNSYNLIIKNSVMYRQKT
jgi:hypothetical protein